MTGPSAVALVCAVAVLAWVIRLVRRGMLSEQFAAIWLAVGFATVLLAAFPSVLYRATNLLHFELPVNLLFLSGLLVQLVVSVHLSVELGRRQTETRRLAEQLAVLQLEVRRLRQDGPRAQQDATEGE